MPAAWLPLRADLPGRADLIAEGRQRLATGAVALTGEPGIGKTAVAGALVAGSGRAVLAVSLVGCEEPADTVRALGDAAGVRPAGDEAALLAALRGRGPLDLVVDDIAHDAILEPVHRLVAALDARLVLVGESLPEPALRLGPLPDPIIAEIAPSTPPGPCFGNPTLARLAAALSLPPDAALERLGPAAALLAAFPPGFAVMAHGLPAAALVPDDRVLLRRGIAARLAPNPDAVAALPLVAPLLALARGTHLPTLADPRDLLLLRQLSACLPPGADRARCVAAAARLAAQLGQVEVGRGLIAAAIPAHPRPGDLATLFWADGDVLLAAGEVEDARVRWADAAGLYRRAHDPAQEAAVLRRSGDRLAARGLAALADAQYRGARQVYRASDDALGVLTTLRGAADLAVGAGEGVSAGTLHEQVETALDRGIAPLEHANLRVAEATLAIARGEYARAERLLAGLGGLAADDALLRANVGRRRADLLLRRGRHDDALAAARAAGTLYAGLGEAAAHAACVRLEADVAAAAGNLGAARERYVEALRLQVRIQDLTGLSRTLEHAAFVEESIGDVDRARVLRQQRAAVKDAS